MRFGISEAHGKGCLSQFNYLREAGAITFDPAAERYSVDLGIIPSVMSELAGRYLMMEATGDYAGVGAFFEQYGQVTPELEAALKRLESVPVDIVPSYSVVEMIDRWKQSPTG